MRKLAVAVLGAVLLSAGAPAKKAADAPGKAEKAEAFSLPDLDGKQVKLEDALAKGYVVLNFWARWCSSCKEEIPQLAELMKSPGADKTSFIGVNVGDSADKAGKFAAKFKYPYAVLLDKDKAVAKKYGVMGLPVTMILARDGRIVFRGSRPPKTFDFTK
ncbi:MAG: TlpA disulfide reductase family protein [Elusimicrobia bacterium]|nr:TlpA disulfide reductase family protein [Elusimicrobiota bacterium]